MGHRFHTIAQPVTCEEGKESSLAGCQARSANGTSVCERLGGRCFASAVEPVLVLFGGAIMLISYGDAVCIVL